VEDDEFAVVPVCVATCHDLAHVPFLQLDSCAIYNG
jgi:hypothetical protein